MRSDADISATSEREGPQTLQIEFDDIVYQLQAFGGISEYWREMTSRVAALPDFQVVRRAGRMWGRMQVQRSTSRVFHSSYYRTARGPRTRSVTTVHDLAYELGHVGDGSKALLHRIEHRRAYYSSDALICVSQSTRRDLLQVYPDLEMRCPIFVAPHGVTPLSGQRSQRGQPPIAVPYVLFVGGRQAYKNFSSALAGFAESGLSQQGYRLVCTGAPLTPAENRQVEKLGLNGSVRAVGKVDRGALGELYASAHCLLYPSLFEGFGLPVIEAMQLNCPVVCSNRSALPEVAGDAALMVDAIDPTAIAAALLQVGETQIRQRLICAGRVRAAAFTWTRSAEQHADVYRMLS